MRPAVRENAPAFALSLALALATKAAFSRLGPDELRWMTWPMQALVGVAAGLDFTYEAGYGYVDLAHRLVIAKSCTGVNYLLAVFGLLVFTRVPRAAGHARKMAAVAGMAAAAYTVTIVVNATRIAVGLAVHEAGWEAGWLTPARVHRLAGIAVYLTSLLAVHAAASRVESGAPGGAGWLAPLVAYAAVTVAIPLANGALLAHPSAFAEHSAWVALAVLVAGAMACVRRRAAMRGA